MGCPNAQCKEELQKDIEGHQKTLYGKDGMSGLVACVKKNVPKSWLWKGISGFGVLLLLAGYSLFARVQAGEILHEQNEQHITRNAEQIEKLEKISQRNEVRQAKIDANLKSISKAIERLARDDS